MTRTLYYANTPRRRAELGLQFVPSRVSGDPTLPWIVHDIAAGRFTFAAEPPQGGVMGREWL